MKLEDLRRLLLQAAILPIFDQPAAKLTQFQTDCLKAADDLDTIEYDIPPVGNDDDIDELHPQPTQVKFGPHGIEVGFTGYGEHTAESGCGSPIYIEACNGHPRVLVFSDINTEDYTHDISLENAQESKRNN